MRKRKQNELISFHEDTDAAAAAVAVLQEWFVHFRYAPVQLRVVVGSFYCEGEITHKGSHA